jgi:hypothetical protein
MSESTVDADGERAWSQQIQEIAGMIHSGSA